MLVSSATEISSSWSERKCLSRDSLWVQFEKKKKNLRLLNGNKKKTVTIMHRKIEF